MRRALVIAALVCGMFAHAAPTLEVTVTSRDIVVNDPFFVQVLIQKGAATTVTSLMYLVPPTTAVMAWALFGEPITALIVAGMALTAVGVSLVVRTPVR